MQKIPEAVYGAEQIQPREMVRNEPAAEGVAPHPGKEQHRQSHASGEKNGSLAEKRRRRHCSRWTRAASPGLKRSGGGDHAEFAAIATRGRQSLFEMKINDSLGVAAEFAGNFRFECVRPGGRVAGYSHLLSTDRRGQLNGGELLDFDVRNYEIE
jgi:hypothetical protein